MSANVVIIWRDRIGIDGILMIIIVDVDSALCSGTLRRSVWSAEDVQAAGGTSLLALKPRSQTSRVENVAAG